MKRGRRKEGAAKMGAPKIIPEGWKRMGYFLHPWVVHAVGALARAEGIHPSVLVNRTLARHALKHKASIPRSAGGPRPPSHRSLP